MNKRLLAVLLSMVVFLSVLTIPSLTETPDHIVVAYLTLGATPPDLQVVQDEVNVRTIPEINVEVEFKAVSAYDAFALFPTWTATGGERIDLMLPILQDIRSYVDQSLLLPLDDLIAENAPYLTALIAEGQPIISGNYFDGEVYAITPVPNMNGQGGGYVIGQSFLDEIGWDYSDEKHLYTLDDLTKLFAQIKEKHPEIYPCGVVTTGKSNSEFFYASDAIDSMGGAPSYTGVLYGKDSVTVENMFELEEYQDYLRHLREWNLAGYIHPDAATMEGAVDSLKAAGVFAGYFMVSAPVQRKEGDIILRLSEPYQASQPAGGWVIPFRSEEPAAAIRFVDMVWRDAALANLIQWGIEGKHYVMLDETVGYIGFPDGVTATTSGYYNTLGVWGDTRDIYTFSASSTKADNDAYTAEASKNQTQGIGKSFNMMNVTNEVAALAGVVAQYVPTLESGSVDFDVYYPQFINALKAAGVEKVIAEKQAQFDQQHK
ncbi:MAG: ABC transporter substrate-binding protein [Clostridiales bacterium]|nr:ABC transporter substrate-binding protein [Clostridiales bacterium]